MSMSSAVGSRAKTSATLAKAKGSKKAHAPVYGSNTAGSFAWFDLDSLLWRTWQLCLDGESEQFSETWPRAGLMRNGFVFKRPGLVRRTFATERLFLPTPQAFDASRATMNHEKMDSSRRHAKGGCSNLPETFNGFPNPLYVEWMMGFPMGWTDLRDSETPSCPKSPNG